MVREGTARRAIERWELENGSLDLAPCGCRFWVRPDPGSTLPLARRPRVSRRVFACTTHVYKGVRSGSV